MGRTRVECCPQLIHKSKISTNKSFHQIQRLFEEKKQTMNDNREQMGPASSPFIGYIWLGAKETPKSTYKPLDMVLDALILVLET